MKKFIVAVCNITLLLGIISCSKNSSGQEPEPPVPVGKVTPVGTVLNEAVTKQNIGPAGGSFTSEDGRITLEFPAGALTTEKEISITPITDQNPMGSSKAYRLQPHGLTFQKPVKIHFNYEEEDFKNSLPEFLGIAYQDEEGIWHQRGGTLNKNNQTYTISTTHFSDWSFFETCKLVASANTIGVNGTVQLEVQSAAFYVPLVPDEESPLGELVDLTPRYVKRWKLAGAGTLTGNGAKGTYKAPPTVPNAPNPVAISVELDFNQRGKYLVATHITITDDDGELEIAIGGGGFTKRIASPAVKVGEDLYAFGDADGDQLGSYVYVMWKGGLGTHGYKLPGDITGTHVHYEITDGANYTCYYVAPDGQMLKSGGGVTITSMGEDDGYIKGTFEASPAGIGPLMLTTTSISGRFRVKRAF